MDYHHLKAYTKQHQKRKCKVKVNIQYWPTILWLSSDNCSILCPNRLADIVPEQSLCRSCPVRISIYSATMNAPNPRPWRSFLFSANQPIDFRSAIECIASAHVRHCSIHTASPASLWWRCPILHRQRPIGSEHLRRSAFSTFSSMFSTLYPQR